MQHMCSEFHVWLLVCLLSGKGSPLSNNLAGLVHAVVRGQRDVLGEILQGKQQATINVRGYASPSEKV